MSAFGSARHLGDPGPMPVPAAFVEEKRAFPPNHPAYMIAYAFTVGMFAAYSGPIVICLQLVADPDANFWIGHLGLLVALIPVVFLVQYVVHVRQLSTGKPKKQVLWVTAIVPAVLLCIMGGRYMSTSRFLYGQLISEDCSGAGGLVDKPLLQLAYQEANDMLHECKQRLQKENGNVELRRVPVLQACEEWANSTSSAIDKSQLARDFLEFRQQPIGYLLGGITDVRSKNSKKSKNKDLDGKRERFYRYLATLEANHVCGGFCTVGPMLWHSDHAGRERLACSQMVALKFRAVEHEGEVLFWSSLLAAGLSLLVLEQGGSRLSRLGYHW